MHKSNSTEKWLSIDRLEERLVAHCTYIFGNASRMKMGRKVRQNVRSFDADSHLYWSKTKMKEMAYTPRKES